MKSFYVTNKYGDWMFWHVGNIRGAIRKAQDYANKHNELVIKIGNKESNCPCFFIPPTT